MHYLSDPLTDEESQRAHARWLALTDEEKWTEGVERNAEEERVRWEGRRARLEQRERDQGPYLYRVSPADVDETVHSQLQHLQKRRRAAPWRSPQTAHGRTMRTPTSEELLCDFDVDVVDDYICWAKDPG